MEKKNCKIHNTRDISPLEWWQVNGGKYYNVARVTQKCRTFFKLTLQDNVCYPYKV